MKTPIELPKVFAVSDYHDISLIRDVVVLLNPKIHVEEVGFSGTNYWGIIYCGRKPSKKTVEKLLKEAGFDFNNIYHEVY